MRTLENAVVVITGGSRGLGHAIAEELGFSGAKVVVNYAHSKGSAEELVARLRAGGSPEAEAIQADVSDPEQAAMLIQETVKRFGRIDVLVNNAGINIDRSLKSMSVEDWRKVLDADLSSYFYTLKAALPFFMQQRSGTIFSLFLTDRDDASIYQINMASPKLKNRYCSRIASSYAFSISALLAKALTSSSSVERGRWKLVIMASTN